MYLFCGNIWGWDSSTGVNLPEGILLETIHQAAILRGAILLISIQYIKNHMAFMLFNAYQKEKWNKLSPLIINVSIELIF